MNNIFLNEKPVRALVEIKKSNKEIYGSVISREIDTTYAHTVKIIAQLEEKGLVESEKKGRKKILTLTDRGERYGSLFIEMMELFREGEQDYGEELSVDENLSVNSEASLLSDNEI
jgi:DNA-binding MarR family transcriptional regulator